MLFGWSCVKMDMKARVIDRWSPIDFSFLPIQIEKLWEDIKNHNERAVSELTRFTAALNIYSKSIDTFNQRTKRDVHLRDSYDLCAYIVRNSEVDLDRTNPLFYYALEYIDRQLNDSVKFIDSEELLDEWKKKAEKLFSDQVAVHHFLWEQDREQLRHIATFMTLYAKQLNEDRSYIRSDNSYERIKPIMLYRQLPISDQVEIADGTWKKVDLVRRPDLYLVVLKLVFDCSFERTLHLRHPYLMARWSNPFEIAQYILKNTDCDERRMRVMANSFSLVSEIGAAELTSKCLSLLNCSKNGMISFGF